MKKTMKLLAALLALMLGFCCSAQAITQEEVLGVWEVDLKPVFVAQGIPEDQYDSFMEVIGGMSMTFDFRDDQKLLMETITGGESTVEEYSYALFGDYVVVDGSMMSTLVRTGDTLTMTDPDGSTYIMTLKGAAAASAVSSAPADACGLVGVWDLDIESILKMSGISDADYEQMKPLLGDMTATLEFTADGRMVLTTTVMGQTNVAEQSYSVQGNQIIVNDSPAEYTIVGNQLTIMENNMSLTMTRNTTAVPAQPTAPVTPAAPVAGGSIVGVWTLNFEDMLGQMGITAEEYEQYKDYIGDAKMTVEFTADGSMMTTMIAMGQTESYTDTYEVSGSSLIIDGEAGSYQINGDQLTITSPTGETMTLTRTSSAAPVAPVKPVAPAANGGIVGVWVMDMEDMLGQMGLAAEEYEMAKGMLGDASIVLEFTADGKAISNISVMGQTESNTTTYEVDGGNLIIEGEPAPYQVNGDRLTITTPTGETLNLTRQ